MDYRVSRDSKLHVSKRHAHGIAGQHLDTPSRAGHPGRLDQLRIHVEKAVHDHPEAELRHGAIRVPLAEFLKHLDDFLAIQSHERPLCDGSVRIEYAVDLHWGEGGRDGRRREHHAVYFDGVPRLQRTYRLRTHVPDPEPAEVQIRGSQQKLTMLRVRCGNTANSRQIQLGGEARGNSAGNRSQNRRSPTCDHHRPGGIATPELARCGTYYDLVYPVSIGRLRRASAWP